MRMLEMMIGAMENWPYEDGGLWDDHYHDEKGFT